MIVQKKMILVILLGLLFALAGCTNERQNQQTRQQDNRTEANKTFEAVQVKTFNVDQIRGIGYPGNDHALYLAAKNGLKIYQDSKWYETTINHHDYMGFQATETGFIASGKPQKGTGQKDPLGLIQSDNKGKSLKKLAFYGQNKFHFIAASFSGNGIYVINEQKNKGLDLGVNYSIDNGASWKVSELKDFTADSLGMMAVHPDNGDMIAMSTRSGIYFSEDNGNTMKLVAGPFMVTALTFIGDDILFSSVENDKILLKTIDPESGEQTNLSFPFLDYENPITFLAVNPKNPMQMAFTTYKNDLYETIDGGNNWRQLLTAGKTESK